ncbi:type II toxin-antitoxin system PemK/MazF family toxin [Paenarthrobacter sp. NPDC089714]|uniref:type II toxin-antitoxin system PemK/MazF family toxin n=1 Tax=Paenarthrobacter sp. NPDC089714 TaxID=3364377 RepID=UPI00380C3514
MALDLRPLGTFILRSLKALGGAGTKAAPRERQRSGTPAARQQSRPTGVEPLHGAYPGDYHGRVTPHYAPKPDGKPDPGEIVWSWVPYEEDHTQGKDRPVLLVGRDGKWLLGLMLTSKDHDNGMQADDYVDIGAGPWDRQGRPSEVKVDRVIRLDPGAVRREGAVLGKAAFGDVARALHGKSTRN